MSPPRRRISCLDWSGTLTGTQKKHDEPRTCREVLAYWCRGCALAGDIALNRPGFPGHKDNHGHEPDDEESAPCQPVPWAGHRVAAIGDTSRPAPYAQPGPHTLSRTPFRTGDARYRAASTRQGYDMGNKMLIDATHAEETRVVVVKGNRIDEFDFESASRRQLKGNIYLAKVTRVEPSLQAAFVEYGGNRHGFLAFAEIHPDYYQIPVADRQALLREQEEEDARHNDHDDDNGHRDSNDGNGNGGESSQPDNQPDDEDGEAPASEAMALENSHAEPALSEESGAR